MAPELNFVALPNGVGLFFAEQGDPEGVPVVLLHGVTDSWRSFEGVMAHLPPSLRAIAVTLRGHGASDRPETGYAPADFAADVASLLDCLGIARAVVVGHSMGSYVAQRFAFDYPDRTLGLVLAGSFGSISGSEAAKEYWEEVVSKLEDPIPTLVAVDFQRSTIARHVDADFFAMAVRESLSVPARVWRDSFRGFMENGHTELLAEIEAPTLVVWGDADAFFPESQQHELLASIPDSRLSVWEGAGHALHWEEPERFAAEVAAFARELESRRRPPADLASGRPSGALLGV
jgi:pimeloyl-ACP methyl ester carboxylesterase